MSNLTYINEEGAGTIHSEACHFSQCVVLSDHVKLSGQGGWDNSGSLEYSEIEQVTLAFDNVDRVLKAAGLRGLEDVYSLRSYHVNIGTTFEPMVKLLKERFPTHRPVMTCVGVTALAFPKMLFEVEVEAKKA